MKRIYIGITALAALLTISSCEKESLIDTPINDGVIFHACIGETGTTRTYVDGLKISWNDNDLLDINGSKYKATIDGSDTSHATFSPVYTSATPDGGVYKAIYPSYLYHAGQSPYFELPALMEYNKDRYNIPLYAESVSNTLVFNSVFATIKICLPDDVAITSLSVTSDSYLNGRFDVDTSYLKYFNYAEAIIKEGSEANKTTTVNFDTAVKGADVYLPVPAGTYGGQNLTFTITKSDGVKQVMSTNQNEMISIDAGTIYCFNFRQDGFFPVIEDTSIGYSDIL